MRLREPRLSFHRLQRGRHSSSVQHSRSSDNPLIAELIAKSACSRRSARQPFFAPGSRIFWSKPLAGQPIQPKLNSTRGAISLAGKEGACVNEQVRTTDSAGLRFLVIAGTAYEAGRRSPGTLTEREQKVLLGILGGLTNKKIGCKLGISEGRVKASVQQLFGKAGVRTRSRLVREALEGSLAMRYPHNQKIGRTVEPGFYFLCAARLHAVSAPVGSIAVFPCSM